MLRGFLVLFTLLTLQAGTLVAQPPKVSVTATYAGESSDVWLARLKDTDDTLRIRAAYALGQIDPPSRETVAALIKGVDDRAQEVRWYSADSLGRIGPAAKEGVVVLLGGVKDPANDMPFKRTAAQSFGRIGVASEEAVPWLVESLRESDAPLKVAASLALWRIKKHPGALPALTESLADPSGEGSYLASMALLELGAEARPSAPSLVKTLGHESADARRAAARVLGKLGPEMISPLSKALGGTLKSEAEKENAVAALTYLIDDARLKSLYDSRASAEAFSAAEKNCAETALPALIKLFDDTQPGVRAAAARAAARIGLPAVPGLVAVLNEGSAQAKITATESLTRLEEYLPAGERSAHLAALERKLAVPLIAALRSRDAGVRAPAIRLFAELQWGAEAQEALPLLREELKSPDASIRRNAAKALDQVQKGVGPKS